MTFSFPTTPEAFADVQAQITGKPVGATHLEAIDAWVPIFNDCFQAGRRGDRAELDVCVGRLDKLNPGAEHLVRFLNAARAWMIYAWEQGHERSKTA